MHSIHRFRPLAGLSCINPNTPDDIGSTTVNSFRPLAGLSCINLGLVLFEGGTPVISFRPLAGLSCINRGGTTVPPRVKFLRFRPLAGLSCINRNMYSTLYASLEFLFPSPRGVELHKPWNAYDPVRRTHIMSFRPLAGLSCINRK